ncbi:response regulator transcription factor [Elioraea tepidiphila]|jgi:CheY-like chemotaxis protein|uniref:response regulator transcription factor n=1 Tax=Elioraea tepidiphila TaxID=457934 RepID=UPI000363C93F|nr:response regulator [Elioraea tepidiphila]
MATPTTATTPPAAPANGKASQLLLLEDNPALARVVATVAQAEGWVVHTCVDTAQFVEALETVRPDAAIVDCMLAEGSGLDVLGRLAATSRDAPVLIMSGYGDTLLRLALQTAERSGLTRVSTQPKPFAASALRSFLHQASGPPPAS